MEIQEYGIKNKKEIVNNFIAKNVINYEQAQQGSKKEQISICN